MKRAPAPTPLLLIGFLLTLAMSAGSIDARARAGVETQSREIVVDTNHMIPMRDGVRLATDIYRPADQGSRASGQLPVLLHRTPYGKTSDSRVAEARFFAADGYIVAVQDTRGRFDSEGTFTKYIGEGKDGFDTIEYLATLPYSDAQVASFGTSYAAHTQANAAKLKPPHLATMVLNMGGMYNGWDHKIRNNGAFELQQVTWAFRHLAAESEDPTIREMLSVESIRHWLTVLPLRSGLNPLSVAPNFEDYILKMQNESDYGDYWRHPDVNWQEYFDDTADVPMVHVTGWYDSYCGGTINNFVGLRQAIDSPIHLVVGPWTHGGNTRSYAGDVDFGDDAAIPDFYRGFHKRWFDQTLKNQANPRPLAPVEIFVMGSGDGHLSDDGRLVHGGYWRREAEWPLSDTRATPYYFHENGLLSVEPPSEEQTSTTYTFDPDDPVPTIGGSFSSTSPVFESGAYDQREREDVFGAIEPYMPLRSRRDVVVFQTEPLEEDMEIVGPITVRLHVSSSAPDTDFTVKLIDVYPPSSERPLGFEMNLTDGILRARYRNSPSVQEFMLPDVVYDLEIKPFPTANRFKTGHRIRVDISSSNFPRFDVNPNTGEPLGSGRRSASADNTIHHNRNHPSQILLPIVPIAQE